MGSYPKVFDRVEKEARAFKAERYNIKLPDIAY